MEQNIPEKMLTASQDIERQMKEAGDKLKEYVIEKENGPFTVKIDGSMEVRKITVNGVEQTELVQLMNDTLETIRQFQEAKLMELPFVQSMQ